MSLRTFYSVPYVFIYNKPELKKEPVFKDHLFTKTTFLYFPWAVAIDRFDCTYNHFVINQQSVHRMDKPNLFPWAGVQFNTWIE